MIPTTQTVINTVNSIGESDAQGEGIEFRDIRGRISLDDLAANATELDDEDDEDFIPDKKESLKDMKNDLQEIKGRFKVGTAFRKEFDGRIYEGTVINDDAKTKWYRVRYNDGDDEDLTHSEVKKLLIKYGEPVSTGTRIT